MDYAGEISVVDCWALLEEGDAVLVDVRTSAEWAYVGAPDLRDGMKPLIGQEWQVFPQMSVDTGFADKLSGQLAGVGASKDTQLCFLCRSGVRSLAAARAMTAAGYTKAYNVTGGFEGDLDDEGHRGRRNGWKAEALPWRQR